MIQGMILVAGSFRPDNLNALPFLHDAGQYRIHLCPDEQNQFRVIEPQHQDYYRSELPVDLIVVSKIGRVESQRRAGDEHQDRSRESTQCDPLERQIGVRGQKVENRVSDGHR